jgi:hypothetical protein
MLSSRYAPAVCVALVLALIPTVIHSYAGLVVADGRTTASIGSILGDYSSVPTDRDGDWGRRRFESHDWFEREYVSTTDRVVLTVVRSYDLKSLYHHPELGVAYHRASFTSNEVGTLPQHPDMPIHVLSNENEGPVGLYVLHYDGRFVDEPIRFQIRTAGELLFSGRKAMTLFFVRDDAVPAGVAPLDIPASRLLVAAVQQFLAPPAAAR